MIKIEGKGILFFLANKTEEFFFEGRGSREYN